MSFVPFADRFPDLANDETRWLVVPDGAEIGLPPDEYGFMDMYCNDKGCDCRRVFFSVLASRNPGIKAVLTWGWEDRSFYQRWLGSGDKKMIDGLKGPCLDISSSQSDVAKSLLKFFKDVMLEDQDYVERIKRHYAMFRKSVAGEHMGKSPTKMRTLRKVRKST